MSNANAARFEDVTLELGGRRILDNVSLEIPDCEFVGILGPNGAGKTTLMRSILGLAAPSHGSISVLGKSVSRGNVKVGYMPQLRGTSATMRLSGWDFVASVVNGHRFGLPIPGKAQRVEINHALDLVNAGALARRSLSDMSGGERQRLLLAQTLIGTPRLLLLDEPLNSLDPHRAHEMLALIKRVQQELGITVMLSAHELNQLVGVMDKVLYLARGRAALGTVDEVITTPTLSRLYGSKMDVVRADGHIFVVPGSNGPVAGFQLQPSAELERHVRLPEVRHYA
jgi:zinc/manganese transport system ATP-binding protein